VVEGAATLATLGARVSPLLASDLAIAPAALLDEKLQGLAHA
jgi:hypothetical protein